MDSLVVLADAECRYFTSTFLPFTIFIPRCGARNCCPCTLYMLLGGVPFYYSPLSSALSLAQNIPTLYLTICLRLNTLLKQKTNHLAAVSSTVAWWFNCFCAFIKGITPEHHLSTNETATFFEEKSFYSPCSNFVATLLLLIKILP